MLQRDISKREKEVEERREKGGTGMNEGKTKRKSRSDRGRRRGRRRNGQRIEVKKRGMDKKKGGRKERR